MSLTEEEKKYISLNMKKRIFLKNALFTAEKLCPNCVCLVLTAINIQINMESGSERERQRERESATDLRVVAQYVSYLKL